MLPAVNSSLQNLGDGNWKMGAGFGKGGNVRNKAGGVDEGELLENFICTYHLRCALSVHSVP